MQSEPTLLAAPSPTAGIPRHAAQRRPAAAHGARSPRARRRRRAGRADAADTRRRQRLGVPAQRLPGRTGRCPRPSTRSSPSRRRARAPGARRSTPRGRRARRRPAARGPASGAWPASTRCGDGSRCARAGSRRRGRRAGSAASGALRESAQVKIGVTGRPAASKPSSPCQKVVTPTARHVVVAGGAGRPRRARRATASSSTAGSCSTPPSRVSVGV